MSLVIADNIACEFVRLCRALGESPERTLEQYFTVLSTQLSAAAHEKSILGKAWKQEAWRMHPPAYFATFKVSGTPRLEVQEGLAASLISDAKSLSYDPQQFLNHYLACLINGMTKKHFSRDELPFSI